MSDLPISGRSRFNSRMSRISKVQQGQRLAGGFFYTSSVDQMQATAKF